MRTVVAYSRVELSKFSRARIDAAQHFHKCYRKTLADIRPINLTRALRAHAKKHTLDLAHREDQQQAVAEIARERPRERSQARVPLHNPFKSLLASTIESQHCAAVAFEIVPG